MRADATHLFDLPHAEARRLLEAGTPVFVPINPVEYHGPHLSLHNDHLLSRGLIDDLHRAICPEAPLLITRDLELGVDPCPGPGTRFTALPLARRAIRTACGALADLGARRIVLMTFHGSPLHAAALQAGVRLLERRGVAVVAPFNLMLQTLLVADGADFADVGAFVPAADRAAVLAHLPVDFHAGFFETSLALHYAPASVHPGHVHLPPCPAVHPARLPRWLGGLLGRLGARGLARDLRFAALGLGWYHLRPFPGYTNRPHLASAAAGAWFARRILDEAAPVVRAALYDGGPSPAPILRWLAPLTLGGRVGSVKFGAEVCALPPPAFYAEG